MPQAVKLSDALITAAGIHGVTQRRSIPKQIEYWAFLGKMAEENSDLPPRFVTNTLLAKAEAEAGDVQEYTFG
uniref:ParD-like antitoxin of type II toxin-antitoxin system n=1 Tax=Candidatus Kentrum sp. LFY TaxID=2126342 RepID=A0A450UW49_9GAMM|nr:MAG: ParD-like antitoxin of type II toxin-antitoxin system [Candidatus Kentron sp. LFY]VFK15656.1 MAG: ParD-like antitoxin of type II toxin-antitoxin system [Candidatus Kentron sp. LFY]